MKEEDENYWIQELEKCKNSFYYYLTNYFLVGGKKVKTGYTEKEINELYRQCQR